MYRINKELLQIIKKNTVIPLEKLMGNEHQQIFLTGKKYIGPTNIFLNIQLH